MLARLLFGLVLGLIMYMPRPRGPESLPPSGPPGTDETPPGIPPDIESLPGDLEPIPMPTPLPTPPRHRHPDLTPSLPPTPPPGYEGEWPPATERPDAPPTPPPGHDGPWPGRERASIIDQLRELIRSLGELGTKQPLDGGLAGDAKRGATDLGPDDGVEYVEV